MQLSPSINYAKDEASQSADTITVQPVAPGSVIFFAMTGVRPDSAFIYVDPNTKTVYAGGRQ